MLNQVGSHCDKFISKIKILQKLLGYNGISYCKQLEWKNLPISSLFVLSLYLDVPHGRINILVKISNCVTLKPSLKQTEILTLKYV